jgi:hypothetical protein
MFLFFDIWVFSFPWAWFFVKLEYVSLINELLPVLQEKENALTALGFSGNGGHLSSSRYEKLLSSLYNSIAGVSKEAISDTLHHLEFYSGHVVDTYAANPF